MLDKVEMQELFSVGEKYAHMKEKNTVEMLVCIWRADFQNLIHPLLHVTHLKLRSQQRSQFSTQNWLQMENVILMEI